MKAPYFFAGGLLLVVAFIQPAHGQVKLEVEGSILIQTSSDSMPTPGTIRWSGSDFEGWNGLTWSSLTGNAEVDSVTDIDGNVYSTIRIGNQVWMAENLRVTRYNDGVGMDEITDSTTWYSLSVGAWCWYNNDSSYESDHGKLYNQYAALTGKLCPVGWHIPSIDDGFALASHLDPTAEEPMAGFFNSNAGGMLKSTGTIGAGTGLWEAPNTGATNESGFSGQPGGYRYDVNTPEFRGISDRCFWWSDQGSMYFVLWHSDNNFGSNSNGSRVGHSIRCIKDE